MNDINNTSSNNQESALSPAQMEDMLNKMIVQVTEQFSETFSAAVAPVSEVVNRLAGDFEAFKPAAEQLKTAADAVSGFDQRLTKAEEEAAKLSSRVEDFINAATPATPAAPQTLYKKYGMIAGQGAIMLATLGAIAYSSRGTRVVPVVVTPAA